MKNTRSSRLWSVLLCTAMVFVVLVVGSVNVFADDDPVTGLTYNIIEGEAEITGFTAPIDFDGQLEIPALLGGALVTKIADNAFTDCTSLQKVEIPSSVTAIGVNAFSGCTSLSAAYFYGDAPTMGSGVFVNAEISFTVYYLSEKTGFTNPWNGYTTATFGDIAVTGVSLDISSVTITAGENVQLAATVAPDDATNKAVVWSVYSESGTDIATVSSTGQITANNPGTAVIRATSVADDTKFAECNVTVPEPEFTYTLSEGAIVITGYNGSGGDVAIPRELDGYPVTGIGAWSICGKSNITSVFIPDSITFIGEGAFGWTTGIPCISIPDSVVSIGDFAFAGGDFEEILVGEDNPAFTSDTGILYDKLKTELIQCPANYAGNFTIPNSVTYISHGALAWSNNVTEFILEPGNTALACEDGVLFNISLTELIKYPSGKIGDYAIPEGITSLGEYAFFENTDRMTVYVPASVTYIGKEAFSFCSNLTAAYFYGNAPSMGENVFQNAKAGFTIYYLSDKTGFTNPWNGYPTATFENVAVTGVSLDISLTNITVGENVQLTATIVPDDAFDKGVVWSVYSESGTNIATVSSTGQITANNPGTAVIRATSVADDTKFAECNVTVPTYDFSYTITEGKATITGFTALTGFDGIAAIPDTLGGASVTSIGDSAFYHWYSLTNITIPIGVTSIGNNAFSYCNRLKSITIPGSVTSIGNDAFFNCYSLAGITIPSGVTSIGNKAFSHCFSLTSITLSDSVKNIGSSAFSYCENLTGITIPDSVTSILESTFASCYSLTSITIPDSVSFIGADAFSYCKKLTSITIPSGVTSILENTFTGCYSLTSITIPNSVTSIGNSAFLSCISLSSITIPDSVKNIGANAFSHCEKLTGITIPDSVTSILGSTFTSCYNLTSITIPNSVTSIGSGAFDYCYRLTDISIPDSVSFIGINAFHNCSSLLSITIPSQVTRIEDGAFAGCNSLTGITIPDGVTSIGRGAFENCGGLTSVTIPSSVTSIGSSAFKSCKSLTSITIPSGVTSIADSTFWGCWSLTNITIPENVTSIGYDAFINCTSLTSITIPSSVTSIGWCAFAGCSSLRVVTMQGTINSMATEAFSIGSDKIIVFVVPYGQKVYYEGLMTSGVLDGTTAIIVEVYSDQTGLTYLIIDGVATIIGFTAPTGFDGMLAIPDTICGAPVTSIGDDAFYDCTSLTSISIPDSVISIGDWAFWGCSSLSDIAIPDSLTSIGEGTFAYCESLTDITIPDSVTSIGEGAFYSCASLTYITIPDSVVSIGQYAFAECTSLSVVTFDGTVTNIGTNAFFIGSSEVLGFVVPYGLRSYYEGILSEDVMNGTIVFLSEIHTDVSGLTYLIFDEGATIVDFSAPTGFDGVLAIPDTISGKSVTAIGDWVFADCINLTEISIPSSVTSIGEGAFDGCSSLIAITIPDGVTSIWDWTFYGCTSLSSITIPSGVTNIGEAAFFECSSLTSITIPNSITSIGEAAFDSCTSLIAITIPDGVTSIWDWTFYGCTSLSSITMPSVTNIGEAAFYECSSLSSITMPSSVTNIGEAAFYGCSSLIAITIPEGVTSVWDWTFYGCTSLSSITMPSSVTNIGEAAFYGCSSLTIITIPSSVMSIGDEAFAYCGNLGMPVFEGEKPIFGQYVFDDCAADIKIYYHISHAVSWEEYTDYPTQPYCFVSFNLQDGSVAKKVFTEVEDALITAPANPTRANYVFGGWYKEAACTNAWNFENDRVTTDTILYAKWTRTTYVISVTTNNTAYGKATGAGTYYANGYVSLFATPNAGYRFVGWKNGTTLMTTSAAYYFNANKNIACTAEFELIGTPSLYAASAGYTGIQLSWPSVSGASWYEIYRSPSAGGAYTLIATTGASSYIDYGRTTNVNYYYQVRVCCSASTATTYSSISNVASAKPVPAAPTLWVAEASYNKINVTWSATPGATGYQLYRSTSPGGPYTLIRTTSLTGYSNTSLKTGTTYYYKVRAYGTYAGIKVYGDYSVVASLMPKLASVSTATATPYYPTSIKVTWNAVAGRSYYEVWRSTSPDSGFALITRTSYTYFRNTSCIPNTTYYYMIRAYRVVSGIKIYSNFSPVAGATTSMGTLTGAKAVRSNATTNKVSWSSALGRTKYEIWYSTVADGEYTFLKETTSTYSYQYGLSTGTTYFYKIRAYRLVGGVKYYGNFSGVVSATP